MVARVMARALVVEVALVLLLALLHRHWKVGTGNHRQSHQGRARGLALGSVLELGLWVALALLCCQVHRR